MPDPLFAVLDQKDGYFAACIGGLLQELRRGLELLPGLQLGEVPLDIVKQVQDVLSLALGQLASDKVVTLNAVGSLVDACDLLVTHELFHGYSEQKP